MNSPAIRHSKKHRQSLSVVSWLGEAVKEGQWNNDAEKYYGISPYAYCEGDPVNFADLTGMAYYDVSKDGTITMREDEHINDKTDFLFAEGNGSSIEIKDKSILSGLKKIDVSVFGKSGKLQYTSSRNAGELLDVFKFLHENTNIEWGIAKYNDGISILGAFQGIDYSTLDIEESSPTDFSIWELADFAKQVGAAHSHINSLVPSVNYNTDDPSWESMSVGRGDQANYADRLRKVSNDYNKMAKHFIYFKGEAVEYNATWGKYRHFKTYQNFKTFWLKL